MTLSEMIAAYGDKVVQFQNLDQCADRLSFSKRGTMVTFGTPVAMTATGLEKLGLVVWFDRTRLAEIIAAEKAAGGAT